MARSRSKRPASKARRTPSANPHKYSVIIPTYNERRNLPIITYLLEKTFAEQYTLHISHRPSKPPLTSFQGPRLGAHHR